MCIPCIFKTFPFNGNLSFIRSKHLKSFKKGAFILAQKGKPKPVEPASHIGRVQVPADSLPIHMPEKQQKVLQVLGSLHPPERFKEGPSSWLQPGPALACE